MAKKVLNIVDQAWRATLEEQDDTVLWLVHMMKNNGSDATVLFRGNAVSYGVKGQAAPVLTFGDKSTTRPPRIDEDIKAMQQKGVAIQYVEEDLADRGIDKGELIEGFTAVKRADLGKHIAGYELVFSW